MGVVEEGGKVASRAVDTLRSSPGLLVLVLLQVATLAAIYLASQANQAREAQQQMALIERCFPQKGP